MPVVDAVDVRRLRRSAFVSGLGDGVAGVALPLLAAGVTRDPLAVAAVFAAQHVPWVALALVLPLLRLRDRRTLAGAAGSARAVAVGVVGALTAVGDETILTVQLVALVLGVAQALNHDAERVGGDLLVGRRGGGEHASLATAGLVGLAVIGFPLGGVLYEVLAAVPLLADVAVFAVASLLVLAPRRPLVPEADSPEGALTPPRPGVVPRPGAGTVTATAAVAATGVAGGAALGVLVLFALDDLGLGAPAFGLLLAGLAGCSAVGALAAPTLATAASVRGGAVAGLVVAAAGYVAAWALADPGAPLPAVAGLGVATGATMVAGVLGRAQLHGAAGTAVSGEALRAFHLAVWAATPVGAVLGGLAARSLAVADVLLGAAAACVLAAVLAALVRPAATASAAGDEEPSEDARKDLDAPR